MGQRLLTVKWRREIWAFFYARTERWVLTYSVQFSASNLPSGVYYYRLSAGEFVQTKSMLVIK